MSNARKQADAVDAVDKHRNFVVTVACGPCLRRFGTGTAIGEMAVDGAAVTWAPYVRARRPDKPPSWGPARRPPHRWSDPGDQQTSGGIERRCRRCGHQFRSRVNKLPELATQARLEWVEERWTGPKPRVSGGWRGTVYV